MGEATVAWVVVIITAAVLVLVTVAAVLCERDLERAHRRIRRLRRRARAAEVECTRVRHDLEQMAARLWQLEQQPAAAEFAPLSPEQQQQVFDDEFEDLVRRTWFHDDREADL